MARREPVEIDGRTVYRDPVTGLYYDSPVGGRGLSMNPRQDPTTALPNRTADEFTAEFTFPGQPGRGDVAAEAGSRATGGALSAGGASILPGLGDAPAAGVTAGAGLMRVEGGREVGIAQAPPGAQPNRN